MEDGLVLTFQGRKSPSLMSLNPYCSGRWSRTYSGICSLTILQRLNPYCSGRWSRTKQLTELNNIRKNVLILIVVEDGLVPYALVLLELLSKVLILIVVEDGLVQVADATNQTTNIS